MAAGGAGARTVVGSRMARSTARYDRAPRVAKPTGLLRQILNIGLGDVKGRVRAAQEPCRGTRSLPLPEALYEPLYFKRDSHSYRRQEGNRNHTYGPAESSSGRFGDQDCCDHQVHRGRQVRQTGGEDSPGQGWHDRDDRAAAPSGQEGRTSVRNADQLPRRRRNPTGTRDPDPGRHLGLGSHPHRYSSRRLEDEGGPDGAGRRGRHGGPRRCRRDAPAPGRSGLHQCEVTFTRST